MIIESVGGKLTEWNVWDKVFDLNPLVDFEDIKSDDYRNPDNLHAYLQSTDDVNLSLLKLLITSRSEKRKANPKDGNNLNLEKKFPNKKYEYKDDGLLLPVNTNDNENNNLVNASSNNQLSDTGKRFITDCYTYIKNNNNSIGKFSKRDIQDLINFYINLKNKELFDKILQCNNKLLSRFEMTIAPKNGSKTYDQSGFVIPQFISFYKKLEPYLSAYLNNKMITTTIIPNFINYFDKNYINYIENDNLKEIPLIFIMCLRCYLTWKLSL